jgi:hypothetical protein
MDVHVHARGGHDDLQQQRWTQTGRDRRAIRCLGGANDSVVSNDAAIHRDERASARRADIGGSLGESAHLDGATHVFDVHHAIGDVRAPQRSDAIAQRMHRWECKALLSVVAEGEAHVARLRTMVVIVSSRPAPFGARAAQEFLASGRVVEQSRHGDGRPSTTRCVAHFLDRAAGSVDGGAGAIGGAVSMRR